MDHHKAAAADISGARITHRQRKAGGDRGIDGVAALAQDVGADLRCEFFLRHHHAVLGEDGADRISRRRRVNAALLRIRPAERARDDKRGGGEKFAPIALLGTVIKRLS